MTRERRIEESLGRWFEGEGFTVAEGFASKWIEHDDGRSAGDVTVNIARLARELDADLDRIMGETK